MVRKSRQTEKALWPGQGQGLPKLNTKAKQTCFDLLQINKQRDKQRKINTALNSLPVTAHLPACYQQKYITSFFLRFHLRFQNIFEDLRKYDKNFFGLQIGPKLQKIYFITYALNNCCSYCVDQWHSFIWQWHRIKQDCNRKVSMNYVKLSNF